nr:hypothetical protein [Tanacetum cinerariifolium]
DDDDDEDDDDNDDEEELAKDDEEDKETGKGSDEVRESEDSEKESDDEEEQESRLREEARIQEEEDADELYRDININQRRGLQVTQNVEDTHERLRSLETSFSEYRQTNQFADAVSAIPDIVHQYMDQQMKEAALVEAYEADKAILDTYGDSIILKRRREDDRGSKRQKEGGEQASASTPSEKATKGCLPGAQSASQSAHAEEPVQTTCQIEETPLSVYETGADDQPIIQTSQHPKWFSQPRRPPSPNRAWNTALPAAQGDAQSWISDLAKQADARSSFNKLLDTPIDFSNFIMHQLNVDTLTPDCKTHMKNTSNLKFLQVLNHDK